MRYDFPNFALVSHPHKPIVEGDVLVVRATKTVRITPLPMHGYDGHLLLFSTLTGSRSLRRIAKFVRKAGPIVESAYGEDGIYAYPPHGKPFTIHNREEVADLLASIADDWARKDD